VVYAKSWGALPYFGNWDQEKPIRDAVQALHRGRSQDGADQQRRVQPLPAAAPQREGHRCGDGFKACIAIDEAENRLHVQKAIMVSVSK
jgi:N-acetylornithine carbamoyltransferase